MDHVKKIGKPSQQRNGPGLVPGRPVRGTLAESGLRVTRSAPAALRAGPEVRWASAAILGRSGEENSDSAAVPRTWVSFLVKATNTTFLT